MTAKDLVAFLPILILVAGSSGVLLFGVWHFACRTLMLSGAAIALVAAAAAIFCVPPVTEVGGMFGTGDFARFFVVLWSLVAALTLLLSVRYGEERGFAGGEYTALLLFAAAGMALLSAATSLVGLFLGLESFTLVLYILIAFGKRGIEGAEAGLKYLVLGVVSSSILAFGIALIFASSGTFHLPEAIAGVTRGQGMRPLGLLGWAMMLVAAGFKVSLVPFHLWTPDVYQGAPAPVTGFLSAGSKGAVFSALVGLCAAVGAGFDELVPLLWTLAAVSIIVGSFSALRQDNIKRMLAFSSVVHMGYVLTALLAGGVAGREAVVFYLTFYALASLAAFGVIASFSNGDREPQHLSDYRGAGYRHPFRAAVLAVSLLALAGIPPTGGFMAKLGVFSAALQAGYPGLALLGILASLISLYYYLRVLIAMFMADEHGPELHPGNRLEHLALGVCLAGILALGLLPGPLMSWIQGLW